jgi:hypothetical protein
MNPVTTADGLNAADHSGLSVGTTSRQGEQARANGRYIALMTGPLEQFRGQYIALRDELAAIECQHLFKRLLKSSQIEALQAKLAAIPTEVKWQTDFANLVTTVGGNNMLDNHLSGSAYTASWYIGLIGATSYTTGAALTDTMASHTGWVEDVTYSNASRPTTAWSAAASKSKALSAGLVFNMNGTSTIKGCFLTSNNKSGTTGVLFSAGLFTDGDQPVVNGNTLTVSYTATV